MSKEGSVQLLLGALWSDACGLDIHIKNWQGTHRLQLGQKVGIQSAKPNFTDQLIRLCSPKFLAPSAHIMLC